MLYLKEAMEEFYIVQAVDGFDAHQGCLVNRVAKTKKKRKPCTEIQGFWGYEIKMQLFL